MMDLVAACVMLAFVVGSFVGSFLNVVVYRLPRGMSVARPARSFCPACKRQIPWYRNVPIASWIALNGRCADCRAPIPVRYVLLEALAAALFALLAWQRLAPALDGAAARDPAALVPLLLPLAADLVAVSLILAIAVIDLRHAIIPDSLTVPWLPLFVAACALGPAVLHGHALDVAAAGEGRAPVALFLAGLAAGAYPALFADFLRRDRAGDLAATGAREGDEPPSALPASDERFEPLAELRALFLPVLAPALAAALLAALLVPADALAARPGAAAAVASAAGAGFGLAAIFLLRLVFSLAFGREAMGLGDAKYLALAGALFGAEGCVLVFLLASMLGAVPAFAVLFRKMPLATGLLVASALAPLLLLEPLARAFGPNPALLVLLPVPLIALVLFVRALRVRDVTLTAMPFGPFLALASLVLLLFWQPISALPLLRAFAPS